MRGTPRDALVADLSPPEVRGASFGLRQSRNTAGVLTGPLLAIGLTWLIALVTQGGRVCIGRRKNNLSTVFASRYVDIQEVADQIRLVSFMDYDPGFLVQEENRVHPVGENPLARKVLPMSPE